MIRSHHFVKLSSICTKTKFTQCCFFEILFEEALKCTLSYKKLFKDFPNRRALWDHPFSTHAKFSVKLTCLTLWWAHVRMIPFCFFKKTRILIYVLCNFKGIDFCADLIMIMNSQICFFIQFIIRAKYCKSFRLKFNSQRISLK